MVVCPSDGFAEAVTGGLEALKTKLASMQLTYPNTFKAIHTQIAFRKISAEYKGRLHEYVHQGFFTAEYADAVESIVKGRARGLEQYLHVDALMGVASLLTGNLINADHPIVACFKKDKVHGGAAVATTDNPVEQALD